MKKDRFSALLQLRESVRHRHRILLAESLAVEQQLKLRIQSLENELRAAKDVSRRASTGMVTLKTLVDARQYSHMVHGRLRELAERLDELTFQIRQKQSDLETADRQVKVVKKLIDRKCQKQQFMTRQSEQNSHDELALQHWRNHHTAE